MADQTSSGGSPWEDVLEETEDTNNKPKVFGTLEDNQADATGQLKVPTDIPEGVGTKISSEDALKKEPSVAPLGQVAKEDPQTPAPPPTATPQPATSAPKAQGGITSLFKRKPVATTTQPTQTPAPQGVPKTTPAQPQEQQQVVNKPVQASLNPQTSAEVKPQASATQTPQATLPKQPVKEVPSAPPKKAINLAAPVKNWLMQPKVIITAIIAVLLVGLTYFNETGILPSGLEKVYGIFRLESLWGGLPADSQLALAQSFSKMQSQQTLKMESEVKFTVNRNSESVVTKPLLSIKNNPIRLFALDKAILAVADDPLLEENLDQTESETDYNVPTAVPSADSATSTYDSTTSTTPLDQTNQGEGGLPSTSTEQDSQGQTNNIDSVSTIKEFNAVINSYFSDLGASSQMEISSESGKKSNVSLFNQSGRLYVNSTGVDYSGSSTGWVFYPLSYTSQELLPSVFGQPNLQGFSVTGKRIGSGKFNGIPVYRYQVNIKIGSLFQSIGVQDEMVNSITGEINIGKKDQLIHYMDLIITPSISSAITRIDFQSALSNYGIVEPLAFPENATEVGVQEAAPATTAPVATTPTTTPTVPGVSSDLLARDAQRKVDLRAIESALQSYHAAFGRYPTTSNKEIQTRTKYNALGTALVPNYIETLPVDPMTDKYYYGYKSDGSSYELSALLGNDQDIEGSMTGGKNLFIIRY